MATQVYPPVYGTDNYQPIRDDNAPWRMWGIYDIFVGREGRDRYVPKVKDYVVRPETFETWIVDSVDPVTLVPVLRPISPYGSSADMSKEDILFGVGPGTQAQLLRVYINRSSWPYRMNVDNHCFVGGSNMAYAVIYKNGDPTVGGEPVSRMYDNSGNFIGVEVPLEMVELDSHHVNYSLKVVGECFCNENIVDATPLYVVFYAADGTPRSKAMLLAENTTYIRGLDIQRKFVTGISLESPWLASSDANVLRFPLNIPTNALDLVGVVNYSNGEKLRLPVDGTKFEMAGLDGYISSIPEEKFDLTLIYNLSADEVSVAGQGMYVDRKATAPYSVITQVIEPGYTVKLFGYPIWNPLTSSYRMKFWLYNLARNSHQDVTDYVAYSAETGAFDPGAYGVRQRIQVNLNLRRVSLSYNPMIHTQMFDVTLFGAPSDTDTPWIVNDLTNSTPGYGREIRAIRTGNTTFSLKSGFDTKEEWLQAFYLNTNPIVDRRSEVYAPTPTHFWTSLDNGVTWRQNFLDNTWNQNITSNVVVNYYQTVLIRFTMPNGVGVSDLSIAPAIVKAQ